MAEPTQEQLLSYIDAATTFYGRVISEIPTDKALQSLLAIAGVHVSFERIKTNRDNIRELSNQEESEG